MHEKFKEVSTGYVFVFFQKKKKTSISLMIRSATNSMLNVLVTLEM